ncbi:MAG: ribosomal protein large subunit ribosomal protein [Candidatus Parcubacteria bacterium]|jgi:large subunit ribosomal protein L14
MLQPQSIVIVADNTGAKVARVFKVLGGSKRRYAQIGDIVVCSVQTAEPRRSLKKKDIFKGVVVRQTKAFRRKDGSHIRFDDNAVVVVEKKKTEYDTKGNRVFGPIPRELAEKFKKVVTLAPEVV